MGSPPRPARSPKISRPKAEPRTNIIQAVTNPLGFFVLVVLIVEALLGILAGLSGSADKTEFVRIMATIIVVLIAVVSLLAWFRPDALMGARPSALQTETPAVSAPVVKIFERSNDFLATGNSINSHLCLTRSRTKLGSSARRSSSRWINTMTCC